MPVIFDLAPTILIISSNRFENNLIGSIGMLLLPWQGATHPLLCFIFVRSLRVTFYGAVKPLSRLPKFAHNNKVASNVA